MLGRFGVPVDCLEFAKAGGEVPRRLDDEQNAETPEMDKFGF